MEKLPFFYGALSTVSAVWKETEAGTLELLWSGDRNVSLVADVRLLAFPGVAWSGTRIPLPSCKK